MSKWIRRQAAAGKPLNVGAVIRERPDLMAQAYDGPQPRGWRRCLMDAGVDPYRIVHHHTHEVRCQICGEWRVVLERHLQSAHGTTSTEYVEEFGPDCEVTSETFRVARFSDKQVFGIRHWEQLWSRQQVIDWLLLLSEKRHNLNHFHVAQNAKLLQSAAHRYFDSWDDALRAAGLDPVVIRAAGPSRSWSHEQVLQQLRAFAKSSKATHPPPLPDNLRMAVKRWFTTLEQAAAAAGVELEEISPRAIYKGTPVAVVVAAIRGLEGLKGRERRERLDAIYHGDATARRIVMHHYGSLRQLTLAEGINPAVVATAVYRDETDVQHDLDRLEGEWGAIDRQVLIRDHKRLYNVIIETGWGADRIQCLPGGAAHPVIPPCDPTCGPLRNRMILLRQKRMFTLLAAAREAGVSLGCWRNIELGLVTPSEESERKIVGLLKRNRIPTNPAC